MHTNKRCQLSEITAEKKGGKRLIITAFWISKGLRVSMRRCFSALNCICQNVEQSVRVMWHLNWNKVLLKYVHVQLYCNHKLRFILLGLYDRLSKSFTLKVERKRRDGLQTFLLENLEVFWIHLFLVPFIQDCVEPTLQLQYVYWFTRLAILENEMFAHFRFPQ